MEHLQCDVQKIFAEEGPAHRESKIQRELLEAKLRHIEQTPWPSQATGKVSGIREEERLLMILYYDLFEISKRKSKGEHDDESD